MLLEFAIENSWVQVLRNKLAQDSLNLQSFVANDVRKPRPVHKVCFNTVTSSGQQDMGR